MAAYAVFIRSKTTDPSGMKIYGALSAEAPLDKLEIVATSKRGGTFQVLEGEPAEAIVILKFPTIKDALEWYNSDAYQKALPYRKASAEVRGYLIEDVS